MEEAAQRRTTPLCLRLPERRVALTGKRTRTAQNTPRYAGGETCARIVGGCEQTEASRRPNARYYARRLVVVPACRTSRILRHPGSAPSPCAGPMPSRGAAGHPSARAASLITAARFGKFFARFAEVGLPLGASRPVLRVEEVATDVKSFSLFGAWNKRMREHVRNRNEYLVLQDDRGRCKWAATRLR
jgi:hypothetical protein